MGCETDLWQLLGSQTSPLHDHTMSHPANAYVSGETSMKICPGLSHETRRRHKGGCKLCSGAGLRRQVHLMKKRIWAACWLKGWPRCCIMLASGHPPQAKACRYPPPSPLWAPCACLLVCLLLLPHPLSLPFFSPLPPSAPPLPIPSPTSPLPISFHPAPPRMPDSSPSPSHLP